MKSSILIALSLALAACGGGSKSSSTTPEPAPEPTPEPAPDPVATPDEPAPDAAEAKQAELAAAETAAFEAAKPVFEKHCARCHTKDGKKTSGKKLAHFDMTTYPFGGDHADEIGAEIREVLGIDGGKPTMPADKKGAVKGEELALIKAWSEAFDAAHPK